MGLNLPDPKIINDIWWRIMFFLPAIPLAINFLVIELVYQLDTPNYLININDENFKISLSLIYRNGNTINTLIEEMKSKNEEDISYKEICSKKFSKRLIVCVILNIFQQCTLFYPISIYSNLIYSEFENQQTELYATAIAGFAEFIGYFLSIFVIDRLGRKTLFAIGLGLISLCLFSTAILFYIENQKIIVYFLVYSTYAVD